MIDIIKMYFLPCMINVVVVVYILKKLLQPKDNIFINFKTYVVMLLLFSLSIINFVYVDNSIRFIISTIYTILFSKIIFNEPTHKVATAVIIEQLILFISELIYALIVIFVFKMDNLNISENMIGLLVLNAVISIIAIMLVNLKFVKTFCDKITNYMDKIKKKNKYVLALILIMTLNVLVVVIYMNSRNLLMVIINVVFILVYSYVVYLFLSEKNENIKVKEENQSLLENLNEYEKMLDYQRVANHENKNQLLVVKTMASKNNKRLHAYIDEIIKEKREDDEVLYTSAKRIPSGGLQGLVYQKMLLMKERNINIDLNVSKEVRKVDLSKLNSKTNFEICRAIGIIIDNAIDEVSKLKEKEVSIYMYKENNELVIEIANMCKEIPDLTKIDDNGYTTKEKGHGYGLSLLKNICDNNTDITNERKIMGNVFFQIIKVKLR